MGNNLPGNDEFLIYQTDDGQVKLDVRLENEMAHSANDL